MAYLCMEKWASLVAQMVRNLSAMQETRFNPWVRKIPWRREWLPTLVLLPREFHKIEDPGGLQSRFIKNHGKIIFSSFS